MRRDSAYTCRSHHFQAGTNDSDHNPHCAGTTFRQITALQPFTCGVPASPDPVL